MTASPTDSAPGAAPEPRRPLLLEDTAAAPAPDPAAAPPVPDAPPGGAAMERLATVAAARPSRLARWFWSALAGFLGLLLATAAWDFVAGLLASRPVVGGLAAALGGLAAVLLVLLVVREAAALARLRRIDSLQRAAAAARSAGELGQARAVVGRLVRLYAGRDELRWARERLEERTGEIFDVETALGLAERELLAPLDAAARREVEAAARQVATVTAVVPIALADLGAALFSNLRMIRRIAEIYGGRGGTLGAWRLTRAVLSHLVATGAVAVGDDLLGSLAGGGMLGKLSRRFGEGLVNGALTARVGIAAMEVCRPLPFVAAPRPRTASLVKRALTGLFG